MTLAVTALSVCLVACGDDDPVQPGPKPDPVASTPDSLMSLYRTAMVALDTDLLDALLGEDFRLVLNEWDPYIGPPPPDYMTRRETILAVENMAGGGDVTNWQGTSTPGVTRITVQEWTRQTDWSFAPNALAAASTWYLDLTVDRGPDHPPLAVAGDYEVIVSAIEIGDQQVAWTLYRLDFRGRTTPEDVSLMAAHLAYLTNEPPVARIDVTSTPGDTWPTYTFDPGASSDDDSGLPIEACRWHLDDYPGGWYPWGWPSPLPYTFISGGDHEVILEVRDRWGATRQASVTVQPVRVPMPFPGSPERLMANLRETYRIRDSADYRRLMHPDFVTILQQETIDQFPDVGPTLDYDEERRIHERMFSGEDLTDPVTGDPVPGVFNIAMGIDPLDDWQVSPPDDPIPNTLFAPYEVSVLFQRLPNSYDKVEGIIRFYVASRDSFHEGENRDYFEMVGQLDLTTGLQDFGYYTWGGLKAQYR